MRGRKRREFVEDESRGRGEGEKGVCKEKGKEKKEKEGSLREQGCERSDTKNGKKFGRKKKGSL